MAMRSRPTVLKRERERARLERQKQKAAKRAERSQRSQDRTAVPEGVDPAIAHIRPGPQPLADWQVDRASEEEETAAEEDA